MVDLGTLGGASSYAVASNDRGAVTGRSQVSDDVWHGFLWQHGTMVDLGEYILANRHQQQRPDPGFPRRRRRCLGVVQADGSRRAGDLSSAKAINEQGDVLGQNAERRARPARPLVSRANSGPALGDASDLNDARQVAGGQLVTDGFHATVWQPGRGVTDLGAAAFNRSNTYRINEQGDVIGWIFTDGQQERAVLWRRGPPDRHRHAGRRHQSRGGDRRLPVRYLLTSQLANQYGPSGAVAGGSAHGLEWARCGSGRRPGGPQQPR